MRKDALFTTEETEWIRDKLQSYAPYEVLEMINKEMKFVTDKQFKNWRKNHNCISSVRKCPRKGTSQLFSEEVKKYIHEHYMELDSPSMCKQINEIFGTNYKWEQIKYYRHNHKLKSNLTGAFNEHRPNPHKGDHSYTIPNSEKTRFKSGLEPLNKDPINTIKRKNDGYLWIKLENGWQQLSRYVWEKHTGQKLSKDQKLKFLDGNIDNHDINNLFLLTNAEHGRAVAKKRYSTDPELTKAGILISRLEFKLEEGK